MSEEIRFTSEIGVSLSSGVGSDDDIIGCARQSTQKFDRMENKGRYGFLKYLMTHRHGSPFEHGYMRVDVHVPTFVWWEWVRHRIGMSYSLESSRYRKLDPVFWVPRQDRLILPVENFKAARPQFKPGEEKEYHDLVNQLQVSARQSWETYNRLINSGIAREVARTCLPFSVYFHGSVSMNPRSAMHFLSLRTHRPDMAKYVSYPQAEIDEAASKIESLFSSIWPLTHKAFDDCGRVAP